MKYRTTIIIKDPSNQITFNTDDSDDKRPNYRHYFDYKDSGVEIQERENGRIINQWFIPYLNLAYMKNEEFD